MNNAQGGRNNDAYSPLHRTMEHRLLVAAPLSKRRRRLRMPPAKTSRGLACAAPASTLGAGSIKQLAIPASSLTTSGPLPLELGFAFLYDLRVQPPSIDEAQVVGSDRADGERNW
ncbi:unnamed protein product [Prorocentrum cordatum]|uniref:Uncharacterized protein n=1 Tax=Prorocentrum cordatum TaxID=2364126 RepID=A0ABN9URI7_9DINO|nr:unnamed protein product [Polarella glacialis]